MTGHPSLEKPRIRYLVIVLLCIGLTGCQSASNARLKRCFPRVGMGTDQLAACGCVLADGAAFYVPPTADPQAPNEAVTINIVSYMCPLGEAGIARVSVKNGVALQVFY